MMDAAEEDAFGEILRYLSWVGAHGTIAEEFADHIYNVLNRSYNLHLSRDEFKTAMRQELQSTYKELAQPRVNFTLWDQRAMAYLERSDLVYLGHFINDPAVKQRVIDFLKEAYIQGGRAIGNSPKELKAFMDAFGEQLQLERWQARRIIDTTVSRARNFGHLIAYRQAAGMTFEINGPVDNLTCDHCREMVGRQFSVAKALEDMDNLFAEGPEGANLVTPFLKGSITVADLKTMSSEDLQAQGYAIPPFHPHCRHFTTLVASYEDPTQIPYSIE